MNLAVGRNVTGIEVFEVKLTEQKLEKTALIQIDRKISHHSFSAGI